MAENNLRNQNETLASSIQRKLHKQSPIRAHQSIFKIPNVLLNGNEKLYVPNILPIGPFHCGLNLKTSQGIKLWYLHCLLERNPTPNTCLEYFVSAIRDMEQYCRDCYGEHIDLSGDEFVEMMVVDGCFVIELFRKFSGLVPIEDEDPVFHKAWMHETLRNDLLLLENQLPWRVLNCLFDLTPENTAGNKYSLPQLALQYFKEYTLGMFPRINEQLENKHLLDFIKNSLLRSSAQVEFEHLRWYPIPPVTELAEAGVLFKRGKDGMLNITFKNGVMEIPPIRVYKNGESLFRNLFAYEQCGTTTVSEITSYAVFLDHLIKSEKDVKLLIELGIIENFLGGDIDWLSKSLSNDVRVHNFSYTRLYEQVNKFCGVLLNRWFYKIRTFTRKFQDPFELINFASAVVVVTILTLIQTVYSILSYNKPQQ